MTTKTRATMTPKQFNATLSPEDRRFLRSCTPEDRRILLKVRASFAREKQERQELRALQFDNKALRLQIRALNSPNLKNCERYVRHMLTVPYYVARQISPANPAPVHAALIAWREDKVKQIMRDAAKALKKNGNA